MVPVEVDWGGAMGGGDGRGGGGERVGRNIEFLRRKRPQRDDDVDVRGAFEREGGTNETYINRPPSPSRKRQFETNCRNFE